MPQERANFADPSFEPTDEQLVALAREAFADLGEQQRARDERMRALIAKLRAEAHAHVQALLDGRRSP